MTERQRKPAEWHPRASDQIPLFEEPTTWEQEWQGMPEFVQQKLEPYRTIIVRFRNQEDLDDFARAIDQKLGPKTTSIWHPALEFTRFVERWVDEP